jgi:peptide chain release factor 2
LKKKSRSCGTVFDGVFLKEKKKELEEIKKFLEIAGDDEKIKLEIKEKIEKIKKELEEKKIEARFSGRYDKNNAFFSIYAGTGGKDAEDWVSILYRMYRKFFEKMSFEAKEIEKTKGEGGIKSITLKVKGKYVFGWLKGENGVHRLVRISPFSAKRLRHTSFALVEVLPEIEEKEIDIKNEDLKIETFRASGAGGQYVNRRESAVRITHLPTGIVVTCQSERLQGENRKIALSYLQSKLLEIEKEKKEKIVKKERGELKEAKWGNQIRSYIFHPYQMVRDERTGKKTSKLKEVLDGNLEEFIK